MSWHILLSDFSTFLSQVYKTEFLSLLLRIALDSFRFLLFCCVLVLEVSVIRNDATAPWSICSLGELLQTPLVSPSSVENDSSSAVGVVEMLEAVAALRDESIEVE